MAKSKLVEANKKIEEGVISGYKKIENGVIGTYKKIENKFVDKFLTHEGESVEEAKIRLTSEKEMRETAAKKAAEKRNAQN